MRDCEICFAAPRLPGLIACESCEAARLYWDSLTPAERRAEEASIAAYIDEAEAHGY